MEVGEKIQIGNNVDFKPNNILALESIPDGTLICNLERNIGDGGKLVKSAGSSALVFSHTSQGVSVKLPSGKFTTLNPKCKAMIGIVSGAGRKEKPFLKAGNKAKYMIAHGKLISNSQGNSTSCGLSSTWWWKTSACRSPIISRKDNSSWQKSGKYRTTKNWPSQSKKERSKIFTPKNFFVTLSILRIRIRITIMAVRYQ